MGRRSRHRPEEVSIEGYLLLDNGEYESVTALVPLDVFWKMKALDIVGNVRAANRARAARPLPSPDVGSVWVVDGELVDGELEPPATGETDGRQVAARRAERDAAPRPNEQPSGDETRARAFRLLVRAVHSLDRVAIESKGPRFIETLHLRDMLPGFGAD